ncbi:histidine triad nucleotide-binding protein 3-like [Sinocyclocheilus anshuiensis]|uniref:histidine triad nucleotide-binding protein 3-like n=1 Tax=Sinocyclocheilus anshuiensis TaxID=1608454 RepID=UPI0007BACF56|nr:PREDICTED: histidine triad nucleotide-binding protein 3-like [Sinocyclocheilus anshuiensis]
MGTELLHDGSLLMKLCPVSEIYTLELLITIWLYQENVGNCKSLGKEHVPLVEKLVETGKEILQKNNVTDLNDVRRTSYFKG